jgi:hypothetical protein
MASNQAAGAGTVDVLVVVDVEGALGTNNLFNNVYMIDTNKFMGSYQEGQAELVTVVSNGQTIVWSVTPVDPATSVAITGFTGAAINQQIAPTQEPGGWGSPWTAQASIPLGSSGTTYQYSIVLQFEGPNGVTMTFDPFLKSA